MLKELSEKIRKEKKAEQKSAASNYEGQLAIDVYQTDSEIVIRAPIAGVKLEDINISITDDVINIRGERRNSEELPYGAYLTQECYWGAFSRAIILPEGVNKEKVKAKFKEGILIITVPRETVEKGVKVED